MTSFRERTQHRVIPLRPFGVIRFPPHSCPQILSDTQLVPPVIAEVVGRTTWETTHLHRRLPANLTWAKLQQTYSTILLLHPADSWSESWLTNGRHYEMAVQNTVVIIMKRSKKVPAACTQNTHSSPPCRTWGTWHHGILQHSNKTEVARTCILELIQESPASAKTAAGPRNSSWAIETHRRSGKTAEMSWAIIMIMILIVMTLASATQ